MMKLVENCQYSAAGRGASSSMIITKTPLQAGPALPHVTATSIAPSYYYAWWVDLIICSWVGCSKPLYFKRYHTRHLKFWIFQHYFCLLPTLLPRWYSRKLDEDVTAPEVDMTFIFTTTTIFTRNIEALGCLGANRLSLVKRWQQFFRFLFICVMRYPALWSQQLVRSNKYSNWANSYLFQTCWFRISYCNDIGWNCPYKVRLLILLCCLWIYNWDSLKLLLPLIFSFRLFWLWYLFGY